MNTMTYLDWAATAIPREDIIEESLKESFKYFGNPSSPHKMGFEAREAVEREREKIAKLLSCNKNQLFFTSGATESNNIINLSFLQRHSSGEIITTSIEHPSNSEPLEVLKKFGWKIKKISPKDTGQINFKKLEKVINEKTRLISLIYVHNETGVIQNIKEIIKIIREKQGSRPIFIHLDGVQAAGKIDLNLGELDIDSFSISGHKFGAPKGVGLLYLKNSREVLIKGGGQESGIRPGTESIFNIIALSRCFEASLNELDKVQKEITKLMKRLIAGIREIGLNTIPKSREVEDKSFVPNILSLTAPPVPGEVLVRVLNEKGFFLSTGSACSTNKKSTTKGILSMGISEDEGFSSFRVSIGRTTTEDDIDNFLKALKESVKELAP